MSKEINPWVDNVINTAILTAIVATTEWETPSFPYYDWTGDYVDYYPEEAADYGLDTKFKYLFPGMGSETMTKKKKKKKSNLQWKCRTFKDRHGRKYKKCGYIKIKNPPWIN